MASLPRDARRELDALFERNPHLAQHNPGLAHPDAPQPAQRPQSARSEEDEQIALMQRIEAHTARFPDFQRIHHSPNGGQRHRRTAARMKAAGTRAGFPDLVYPAKRGRYAGLAIEMKVGSNKPTAHQRGWLAWLGEQGWRVAVCYSADEAFDIIMEYERA